MPNIAIVLPDLVKTDHGVTFCLVNVFWIAETANPAAPVINVPPMAGFMASFGWYCSSPPAMLTGAFEKTLIESGVRLDVA